MKNAGFRPSNMPTVSFVIATLNRPAELRRLLASFISQSVKPDEIIIVDQGGGLKLDLNQYLNHDNLAIQYYQVDFQSLTRARNFGVEKSQADIIGFLDDDIILGADYVKNIKRFFENNRSALGVQGVITNFEAGHAAKVGGVRLVYKIYNLLAKIFLLNNSSASNRLLLSGRNQYASRPAGVQICQWLSGIGNYRRAVFKEFKFDEKLAGYALGEDKLFSYPIGQKYPDSLWLDPTINCEHHHAASGRPLGRAAVEMKINYTYYLWRRLLAAKTGAGAVYWWANIGDLLIVFFSVIFGKNNIKFFWWHLAGYWKILWKINPLV